jgi:hypothetical protein
MRFSGVSRQAKTNLSPRRTELQFQRSREQFRSRENYEDAFHKMSDKPKRDWGKTRLHFFCGVVLGAFSGFAWGGDWIWIAASALVTGLLAAIFLDRFWENFPSWWG